MKQEKRKWGKNEHRSGTQCREHRRLTEAPESKVHCPVLLSSQTQREKEREREIFSCGKGPARLSSTSSQTDKTRSFTRHPLHTTGFAPCGILCTKLGPPLATQIILRSPFLLLWMSVLNHVTFYEYLAISRINLDSVQVIFSNR